MSPKVIRIRYQTASGRRLEMTVEDLVYLEILDLERVTSNKPVFIIDLNQKEPFHIDTKVK